MTESNNIIIVLIVSIQWYIFGASYHNGEIQHNPSKTTRWNLITEHKKYYCIKAMPKTLTFP